MVIKYMNVNSLELTTSILKAIAWYKAGIRVVLFVNDIPKCNIRLIPESAPSKDILVCLMSDYDAGTVMFCDGTLYINLPISSVEPTLVEAPIRFIDEDSLTINNGDPVFFNTFNHPGASELSRFEAFGYAVIESGDLFIADKAGRKLCDPYTGKTIRFEWDGEPCYGLYLTNDI